MGKRAVLLMAILAIASWQAPPSWLSEVRAAQATRQQNPPSRKKPRPAPSKARPRKPPVAKPSPKATANPTPAPLLSESGPSETDVARLARVRARRQAVEKEIQKLESQAESTLRDLDSIDLDLRLAGHQFDEAELEFKETTRRLDATIKDVQATRQKIEVTRPRVLKSLAALSKLGELSYARLLFSLDDPADILRGYRYVSRIASADGDQIKTFKTNLARLGDLEDQLKRRTAQNLETRRRLSQARGALAARRADKESRLEQIAAERRLQEQLAADYLRREAELLRILGESGEGAEASPQAQPVPPTTPLKPQITLRSRRGDVPWPLSGALLRRFGVERDPKFGTRTIQQGIEIDGVAETGVRAVHPGRVVFADQFVGYGMLVILDHGYREHTLYGRLGELRVQAGEDVAEGALLGILPNTRVTGSGFHFEVRIQGKPEDPLDWLKKP